MYLGDIQSFAYQEYKAHYYPGFVLWFDVCDGIIYTTTRILLAMTELRGETNDVLKVTKALRGEYSIIKIPAEVHKVIDSMDKARAAEAASLLLEDETGYKLIDTFIEQLKSEASNKDFLLRTYPKTRILAKIN